MTITISDVVANDEAVRSSVEDLVVARILPLLQSSESYVKAAVSPSELGCAVDPERSDSTRHARPSALLNGQFWSGSATTYDCA